MTIEPTQSPCSETEVNIDDPRPTGDISLSDSIVNVEKDELVDEAAEKEFKDSDSLVSGGDGDEIGGGRDDEGGECSSETIKVELPDELAKSVVVMTCESAAEGGSCDVFLIGTSHISRQSCLEVEAIISILKPKVVFVELCLSRESFLEPQTWEIPTISDMIESWKQGENAFTILYHWLLAKIASHLEVCPGDEFRVANEVAIKYGGSVVLGDRPIEITQKRTWAKMPLWHKVKFVCSILYLGVFLPSGERLGEALNDMVTLLSQEMIYKFPTLVDTMVHERDQYMASSLLRVARKHCLVVAVVGKEHINGLKRNWKQPITMNDLMEIPSDKSLFTFKRILPLVAMGVAGILLSRRR